MPKEIGRRIVLAVRHVMETMTSSSQANKLSDPCWISHCSICALERASCRAACESLPEGINQDRLCRDENYPSSPTQKRPEGSSCRKAQTEVRNEYARK